MTTWAYNATRTRNEASNIVEDVESIALLGIMQEAVGSDAFTSRADWVYAYGKTSATVLTVTLSRTNGNPYDVTVTIDTSAKTVDVEVDDNGTITNTSASDYGLWIGRLIAADAPNLSVTINDPPSS